MGSNLTVARETTEGPVLVRALSGKLDESFDGKVLAADGYSYLVLDISEVRHVSSFGVREWVRWLTASKQSLEGVYYVGASPRMVDQFNMVIGFDGGGTLLSFYTAQLCPSCDGESLSLLDCQLDAQWFQNMEAPERQCRICGDTAELDDDPAVLFEYARSVEFSPPPAPVVKALRSEGSWLEQVPGVRLWTRQTLDNATTVFSLSGVVDGSFPARRLVDAGGGGAVRLNLRGISHVEPDGVEPFCQAVIGLAKGGNLTFQDVPPVILRRAAEEPTMLAGGTIANVVLPGECAQCAGMQWIPTPVARLSRPPAAPCPAHGGNLKPLGEPEVFQPFEEAIEAAAQVDLAAAAERFGKHQKRPRTRTTTQRAQEAKDLFAGQYELLAKLGSGGMAEVHIARHHGAMGFRRVVVIKRILPDLLIDDRLVRLFLDEAKLAARIEHPNVIGVYDLGRADNSYFMALEYVHGRSVADIGRTLARRSETIPLQHAVRIIADLAKGLGRAHARSSSGMQLVHRDITPGNVAVSFDGVVKLLDFGLAGLSQRSSRNKFGESVVLGSPAYIAPEIAMSQDAGPEADIWGAGLILLSLLTGKPYFHRPTWERTVYAILTESVQRPTDGTART